MRNEKAILLGSAVFLVFVLSGCQTNLGTQTFFSETSSIVSGVPTYTGPVTPINYPLHIRYRPHPRSQLIKRLTTRVVEGTRHVDMVMEATGNVTSSQNGSNITRTIEIGETTYLVQGRKKRVDIPSTRVSFTTTSYGKVVGMDFDLPAGFKLAKGYDEENLKNTLKIIGAIMPSFSEEGVRSGQDIFNSEEKLKGIGSSAFEELDLTVTGIVRGLTRFRGRDVVVVDVAMSLSHDGGDKNISGYGLLDIYSAEWIYNDFAYKAPIDGKNLAEIREIWEIKLDPATPKFATISVSIDENAFAEPKRPDPVSSQIKGRLNSNRLTLSYGTFHALILGNVAYQFLPTLGTAANDAAAVAKLLQNEYGFNVTLLKNATRTQIIDAFDQLRDQLAENDNLVIYYAGHGKIDRESDRGYWLPVDAAENRRAQWISNAYITDTLKAINAKRVMVIADSCYSGTLTRSTQRGVKVTPHAHNYLSQILSKKTRTVLTSGGLEPVIDTGSDGHSVFANAFLNALRKNAAVIDGTQLFGEIREQVLLNAPQTPQYSNIRFAGHEVGGDFVFVRKE